MVKNKVIVFANGKGGSGKSTTAIHLAHQMHLEGESVELVDADVQQSCADYSDDRDRAFASGSVKKTFPPVRSVLGGEFKPGGNVEWTIVDTRGTINKQVLAIIEMAHLVIIPLELNMIELRPTAATFNAIVNIQNENDGFPVTALLRNRFDKKLKVTREGERIISRYSFPIFDVAISDSTRMKPMEGSNIFDQSGDEMAKRLTIQFKRLSNEIKQLFKEIEGE